MEDTNANPTNPTAREPRPAHLAALARERNLRRDQRRASRQNEGRCPYCGKLPEPGHTACPRCIGKQRERNQNYLARKRTARDEAARRAAPRRCNQCESDDLAPRGEYRGRPYYRCRACGRFSNGDGPPPPPPGYLCPYCKGQCTVFKRLTPTKAYFHCAACKRYNTNLWPADAPSPGGPFPHTIRLCLNYAAKTNLMTYIQAKKMSQAQAIRDIFIRAGQAPLARIIHIPRPLGGWTDDDDDDLWSNDRRPRTVAIPAPPLPIIPPGGIRFPDLRPDASRKFATQSGDTHRQPTVLNLQILTVALNDAALAGLIATMQRRSLNHQEAARALLAEAKP